MSPLDLLALDDSMLASLGAAHSQRWGDTEELLATVAELVHTLIRVTIKAHAKPGTRLPDALRIKRPGEPEKPAMSMGEMARMLARR